MINKFKKGDDRYKLLPTQSDQEAYKSLILAKREKDIQKANNKIYEAYKFFSQRLKKPGLEDDNSLDMGRFKTVLLERLILVNITSEDKDNAYLIFESLNSKGQELTQADLVRNYIFMKLSDKQREEMYATTWLPLQEKFQDKMPSGKEYTEKLTEAFWFYLRKDGESVNEKEIYKSFKNSFDTAEAIPDKIQEVVNFANYYYCLQFPDAEAEVKLQQGFKRLVRLDFTTCHIFLLNIYQDYKNEKLSLKEFQEILCYLESYFVRRLFAGISTKSLGLVFNKLYGEVKQENSQDLVSGLRSVLKKYEKTKL